MHHSDLEQGVDAMPCCEDAAAYSLQTRPNSGGRRSNGAPDPQAALKAARKGNHTCTPAAANTLRFERLAVEVLQGLGLPVGDARTHARTHARTRTLAHMQTGPASSFSASVECNVAVEYSG